MINKILDITRDDLNELSMDWHNGQSWFDHGAGDEHYRLLAYISTLMSKQTIIDVGSYKGDSAVALSFNKSNKVISFDLEVQPEVQNINRKNIDFRIGNVLNCPDLVKSASLIMLDTYHNGDFEQDFVNWLDEIGYKGIVMFDDIHLNKPMQKFWNGITKPKYDISYIGHHSGTGIAIW